MNFGLPIETNLTNEKIEKYYSENPADYTLDRAGSKKLMNIKLNMLLPEAKRTPTASRIAVNFDELGDEIKKGYLEKIKAEKPKSGKKGGAMSNYDFIRKELIINVDELLSNLKQKDVNNIVEKVEEKTEEIKDKERFDAEIALKKNENMTVEEIRKTVEEMLNVVSITDTVYKALENVKLNDELRNDILKNLDEAIDNDKIMEQDNIGGLLDSRDIPEAAKINIIKSVLVPIVILSVLLSISIGFAIEIYKIINEEEPKEEKPKPEEGEHEATTRI